MLDIQMTSFGGQDLEAKHRYSNAQLRGTFLPIDPSPPHPDTNIQLKLDHGVILRKNSYVKTEEQRKILFSLLRNYERHSNKLYALTAASYQIVVEHCGYREPVDAPVVVVPPPAPRPPVVLPQPQPRPERAASSHGYGTIPPVHVSERVAIHLLWALTEAVRKEFGSDSLPAIPGPRPTITPEDRKEYLLFLARIHPSVQSQC